MRVQQKSNKCYLFVYGSMKKGFSNSFRLNDAKFISNAISVQTYALYPSWDYRFPYLFNCRGSTHAAGELYQINEDLLQNSIDIYEGVSDGHYTRETIEVIQTPKGEAVRAQVYFAGTKTERDNYDSMASISDWSLKMEEDGREAQEYIIQKEKEIRLLLASNKD
jgi:gamma-glutamylaminecyclotransferase